MAEPKLWVFFYGSYMNFDVLKEVDFVPDQWEVAKVIRAHRLTRQIALVKKNEHKLATNEIWPPVLAAVSN